MSRHPRAGRSFILLTTLVVIAGGCVLATTAAYAASSRRASADAAVRRVQSRAAAWSGVQLAMGELFAQRDALLQGGDPMLSSEWAVDAPAESGAARIVARLVAHGEAASLATSEAAKMDANEASGDGLAKLLAPETAAADRIVGARAGRRFQSVRELGLPAHAGGDSSGTAARTADRLTVFSAEPSRIGCLGGGGRPSRINLARPWSEEVEAAVRDRLGEAVARALKDKADADRGYQSDGAVIKALREAGLPADGWPEILDAVCTTPARFTYGRVDLNRAPAEVLACIPGIDRDAADAIVTRRRTLDGARLASPLWPVLEQVLTPAQFERCADLLTTRSLQWSIVVESGAAAHRGDPSEDASEPLSDRVVLEAVIDVAGDRPRVAYLRDCTLDGVAAIVATVLASPPADPNAEPPPSPSRSAAPQPLASSPAARPRQPEPPGSAGPQPVEDDRRVGRWNAGGPRRDGP